MANKCKGCEYEDEMICPEDICQCIRDEEKDKEE